MSDMVVVIPTNRCVDVDALEPLIEHGARFIVVDDTPGSIEIDHDAFHVYDWGDRKKFLGPLDEWFPRRNGACRAFGFYLAWLESSDDDVVVALDDDVVITESDFASRVERALLPEGRPLMESSGRHLNILDVYDDVPSDLFPRGFPYTARLDYEPAAGSREVEVTPAFNLGLWRGAFDVNAIDKIAGPEWIHPDATLRHPSVVVPRGALVSVCSMNMHFRRRLIPAAYQLPMHVPAMPGWVFDRYGDIWGGFILKLLMDKCGDWLSVGEPLITHWKDAGFERNCWQEHACHLVNEEFIDLLADAADDVASGPYLEMVAVLQEEIARRRERAGTLLRRYLDHLVPAMRAWVTALAQAH